MQIGCQYFGATKVNYIAEYEDGHVLAIKHKKDLEALFKSKLLSKEAHDFVKSKVNLKKKNIFLVYKILPGGGSEYFIRTINISSLEINVDIVSINCPSKGGFCDMNAKCYVLSTLKEYEKVNFKICFEELNIYSEPEFADFKDINAIDEKAQKAYLRLDKKIQSFAKSSYYQEMSDQALSKESLFLTLSDDQKEVVRQYKNALVSRDEKIKKLGKEQLKENTYDQLSRYGKLRQRLENPVFLYH